MSCGQWRDLLSIENLDTLDAARREEFLAHLMGCASCRRAAAEADPTVVFSLLPAETIAEDEVEEIRRTVQTMRRVRALEASWSRRGRQAMAAGAFAALVLLAVLLLPERSESPVSEEVPFAGAVGVGSGLVSVPQKARAATVELQVKLARSARVADFSSPPALGSFSELALTASVGQSVERDLGHGYWIRFKLPDEVPTEGPILEDFQLWRPDRPAEPPVFRADLRPLPDSPLILGVTTADGDSEQLWLLLTYSAQSAVVR